MILSSGDQNTLHAMKSGVMLIFFRDDFTIQRPHQTKGWIVPTHAPGTFGVIKFRHLVKDLGIVYQRLKPWAQPTGI
jgi:hypothetical protein